MIKRGMTITLTNQGGPAQMYYSASLFRRDSGCIMDTIFSENLIDLKRGVRETWGRLRPGRLIMINRNTVNLGRPGPDWLRWRKLHFSKPIILDPNHKRARRIWPAI